VDIPSGTIVETETRVQFTTDKDTTIPEGDKSVDVDVTAEVSGADGNVSADTITVIVSTLTGVDSVNNNSATSGGADRESDEVLRARALKHPAVRGSATSDAIQSHVIDEVDAVRNVHVKVNNDHDTTADDTFDSGDGTGTDSETISNDGSHTRISSTFTVPVGGKWVQDVEFVGKHGTSTPTVKVRIEGDNGGQPDGNLEDSHHEKTGISPNDNATTGVKFERPGFLPQGTYHVVIEETGGSEFILDGDTAGDTDEVNVFDGTSWSLSSNIENANMDIVAGTPPHSVQPYIQGGSDADVSEALLEIVGGGIRTWGENKYTVTDDSGTKHDIRHSDPDQVTIYTDVTITSNDDWDSTNGPDAIRDEIVRYIGGTGTEGTFYRGLVLGSDVIHSKLIDVIHDVTGVADVETVNVGTSDNPTGEANITIDTEQLAESETVGNIGVTVN
jgi:hypothetical protein